MLANIEISTNYECITYALHIMINTRQGRVLCLFAGMTGMLSICGESPQGA